MSTSYVSAAGEAYGGSADYPDVRQSAAGRTHEQIWSGASGAPKHVYSAAGRIPEETCPGAGSADACICCGKELTFNEIGAHKKFINRGSTRFLCRICLAKELGVSPELIDRKIEDFKRQGCTLFI